MFRLLLVRHAKSSWKDPTLADIDRPLNGRGKRDAPVMASRLKKIGENIDVVFSSPAVRAQGIAKLIAHELNVSLRIVEGLYTFSSSAMLKVISGLPSNYKSIAVVGHNPAITELVNSLAAENIVNVPTSGMVAVNCHINDWHDLQQGSCVMEYFDYPKKQI